MTVSRHYADIRNKQYNQHSIQQAFKMFDMPTVLNKATYTYS